MSNFKNSIRSVYVLTMFLSVIDCVQSMVVVNKDTLSLNRTVGKKVQATEPLKSWCNVQHLTTISAVACYHSLWRKNWSLNDNREWIRDEFINTCCDFSFKIVKSNLKNIYLCKFDSGEELICTKKNVKIIRKDNKALLQDGDTLIKVDPNIIVLPNIRPTKLNYKMKKKLTSYIDLITQDSVGCEILRVAIAKYRTADKPLPKVKFVSIVDKNSVINYSIGGSIGSNQKDSSVVQFRRRNNIIVFSSNWINGSQKWFTVRLNEKEKEENITLNDEPCPKEAQLLHNILHILHDDVITRSRETKMITERNTNTRQFISRISRIGTISLPGDIVNKWIYINDEVFRVLFGMSFNGFDILNEASYLAHRYKYIRSSVLEDSRRIKYNNTVLKEKEAYKLLGDLVEFNGDIDLIRHFLSTKSNIQYPEFGKGSYVYLEEKPNSDTVENMTSLNKSI